MVVLSITGPEASGKTTLAHGLARALPGALVVPEFARCYLQAKGADYTFPDFMAMLAGQRGWEQWFAAKTPSYLICDTDATVFEVWAQERYGFVPPEVLDWKKERKADLHLLCVPDMPWEADPLREHPHDRERLFMAYQRALSDELAPVLELSGDVQTRLKTVLSSALFV
jgi:nicotinamide riboside kinase